MEEFDNETLSFLISYNKVLDFFFTMRKLSIIDNDEDVNTNICLKLAVHAETKKTKPKR